MGEILRTALSLSLSGALLGIFLFLLCRLIGGRLGQAWRYYIWLLVLLRLVLPVAAPVNLVGALLAERDMSFESISLSQEQASEEIAAAQEQKSEINVLRSPDTRTMTEKPLHLKQRQ